MIVDDQAMVLRILEAGLSKYPQIEVVGTATDGKLALNQVEKFNPDVIILDMEMPRMNGIEFLQTLMPTNPIPTIVLSALTYKNSKITDDAFEAGAVDFLPKPSGGSQGLSKTLSQLWIKVQLAAKKDVSHLKQDRPRTFLPKSALDRKQITNKLVLGMGEMDIIDDESKVIKIFALGSCVALAMYCMDKNLVGLAHVALPASKTDPEKSIKLPGYFADTAVPALLNKFLERGCQPSRIFAKIAGGAVTKVELGNYFNIGQKNSISIKANLLKKNIKILADELGGDISRTAYVKPGSNKMYLHHPKKGEWEL